MSTEAKTVHPMARAILAIGALLAIVIAANLLVSGLGIGHRNADFTADKVHTLSDGTREILKELGAPVVIRYYATRSSDYMPEHLKLHMRRVDDLLAQYKNLSGGKLQVVELDPQPDTEAEDSANLDGISGQTFDDQNLFFGLAISCLDRTTTIPYLDPAQETMLEYQISRSVSEVSRPDKPLIGLMAGLPISGGPSMNPMQPGQPAWEIYRQLSQYYEVRDLTMNPEKIEPEIDLLLVIHPADITPEAEFAIDQYVLQGGTVIASIDPYSVAAQMMGGGNPMMGGGGAPTSSTLPTLLGAWGLTMDTQVVADENYQTQMSGNRKGIAVLTVPQDGMPQKDNVITRNLNNAVFFLPGGLTKSGSGGVNVDTLIKSSPKAGLVSSMKASQLDPELAKGFQGNRSYDLVVHLSGNFKTAFPKGKPGTEAEKAEDKPAEGEKKEGEAAEGNEKPEEKKDEKPAHLTEATKPANVFVISDVDAFFDQFAFRMQNFGGGRMINLGPQNGNSSLLLNMVDQAASSTHLIGARSRAAISRPFTKIKEMEAEASAKVRDKEAELKKKEEAANNKLNELQQTKASGTELFLSPEQEAEIRKFRQELVDARKEQRNLMKDLRREKDSIAGRITLANVLGMPLLVILFGIGLLVKRRTATRAR
jgi:ABC-type uncharacterized transport system involved in gliding motility auxiliary subunit